MNKVLLASVLLLSAAIVRADIHQPPASDHGPTRKLARGLANLVYGVTEIPYQIATTNDREGNSAAASYGVARGVGRTVRRIRYGVYDVLLFPFPLEKGKYKPHYRSDTIWKYSGMSEFPPELGWDSKNEYSQ
jgi:putative exosortase-associated protein (TIGR04073 family)